VPPRVLGNILPIHRLGSRCYFRIPICQPSFRFRKTAVTLDVTCVQPGVQHTAARTRSHARWILPTRAGTSERDSRVGYTGACEPQQGQADSHIIETRGPRYTGLGCPTEY
jgi:hypothetical protein